VTKEGDILIGGIDHDDEFLLEPFLIKKKLQKDDHANPSILILQDGKIAIFYSAHNGKNMYFRVSKFSEDISSWGKGNFFPFLNLLFTKK